jgi:predicted RNA-binding Zn-ribbon protein involved in translation (DUF1610 family)
MGLFGPDEAPEDTSPAPIKVGRFAPYPVWIAVSVVVRAAQVLAIGCIVWAFAALFDAMDKASTTSLPPLWLWIGTTILGASDEYPSRSERTSPIGDAIGNRLASQQCPACGQNVFDHTPPSGYAPPSQQRRTFPSRMCTNCGHDLVRRTA